MNNLTVVMYHYVRNISSSRYPGIKGLELHDFENQILYFKKNYNPVTIQEVIASFDKNYELPSNALLMTFDDAYVDHFLYVYPLLKKYKMQGSFYIPAKTVKENKILDVNKIHFILASDTPTKIIIGDIQHFFELYKSTFDLNKSFDDYYKELAKANRFDGKDIIFIKRILQFALPEEMRQLICDTLFLRYVGIEEEVFSKELYMSKAHLEHLLADGMHLGSHGYDHYWWNKLSDNSLRTEIDKSLQFLSELGAETSNWTACYPYGSFSDNVVNMLREKGCKLAFTTVADVANTYLNNRLLVPRLDTNDISHQQGLKYEESLI